MNEILTFKDNNNIAKYDDKNTNSLIYYANLYFSYHVLNSSIHTQKAKKADIEKFIKYYIETLNSLEINLWTPSITKGFQNILLEVPIANTEAPYSPTSVNRIMCNLRHFGLWLHKENPLLAGSPFANVKIISIDEPSWNGLTSPELTRLKGACDTRMNSCSRKNQDPLLEATIFYVLLNTGLRASELEKLNISQYYTRGFHNVKRKGNKVTKKVPVPAEAREFLDRYLEVRQAKGKEQLAPSSPLLVSTYNNRISTRAIEYACRRISKQASATLEDDQKIHLSPHMLRHTFLKNIADKHGVHAAQDLSGNISMREIFRYTKPSAQQKEDMVENLRI